MDANLLSGLFEFVVTNKILIPPESMKLLPERHYMAIIIYHPVSGWGTAPENDFDGESFSTLIEYFYLSGCIGRGASPVHAFGIEWHLYVPEPVNGDQPTAAFYAAEPFHCMNTGILQR